MMRPGFNGSDISARILVARLHNVDRALRAGTVPPDAEQVYSSVGREHDRFSHAVRRLEVGPSTSLGDLEVQGKALTDRLAVRQENSEKRYIISGLAIAGGTVLGAVALGMTIFGGPAAKHLGEILGVLATGGMAIGGIALGAEMVAEDRREGIRAGFNGTLEKWGRLLADEENARHAEKRRGFPTQMLGLEEKRALAAELARSLADEGSARD